VVSDYSPSGDQPAAIEDIVERIQGGEQDIVLLGATGTGKTATVAWVAEQVQRPVLVLQPNKTLAAQFANELRQLFPDNAVEYFVSYYDYYQPEAYVPQTDTYIEKDSSINEEVERLRHSSTNSLLTRRDVIVVATVSCIYGLGTPQEYVDRMLRLRVGAEVAQGSLDFGVLTFQPAEPRLDSIVLGQDELVMLVPPSHPLAQTREVTLWMPRSRGLAARRGRGWPRGGAYRSLR
jgi:excinuclease ABC subunit B